MGSASYAQDAGQPPAPVTVEQLFDLIQVQRAQIEAQQRRIDQLENAIRGIAGVGQPGYQPGSPNYSYADYQGQPGQVAQQGQNQGQGQGQQGQPQGQGAPQNQGAPDRPVGEEDPDAQRRRIDVSGVQDVGGVLTRKGNLVFEPSIEFESTDSTRFFFDGVEIIETVLVGDIEVSDAERQTITAAGTLRYGITNRAEVELKIPFVYRDDSVTQEVIGAGGPVTSDLDATNLGDIEFSGRYQINSGQDDWPIFVANARVKSDSGRGPFDVSRDDDGVETELSTGSGFWAIQPGLTVIYPSDPVVFFGSVSYTHSFGKDVDENIGGSEIGDVQPGDVVGFGFGMGFALNERASFSVGYAHDFVFETEQEIDGVTVESEDFDVGRLSLGFSYALTDDINLNLNTQVGVTDDAPDVVLTLRTPVTFDIGNVFE